MSESQSEYQRVVLVTGSNAGIGYELVKLIAEKGHIVYLAARNETAGKEAQSVLKAKHNLDVKFVRIEVTDRESIQAAKEVIEKNEGRLDVLVNNAGTGGKHMKPSEVDPSFVRSVFSVNFEGVINVTNIFLPLVRKARPGYGVILNVSSILGSNATMAKDDRSPNSTVYKASKAAVNTYTIALAWELKKENIKVNSVHPGWVATRINNFHETAAPAEKGGKMLFDWALLGPEDSEKTGLFCGPDGEIPW